MLFRSANPFSNLTENDFAKYGYEDVPISAIYPTQKNVNINNLKDVSKAKNIKDDVIVVEDGGKFYLLDGHHRTVNNILNEQKNIKARVIK